jgi:hypothetical protein
MGQNNPEKQRENIMKDDWSIVDRAIEKARRKSIARLRAEIIVIGRREPNPGRTIYDRIHLREYCYELACRIG